MKVLKKGAEADILRTEEGIVKIRVSKGYRVKELDEKLRKMRTKAEATVLRKLAKAQVHVPGVIKEDLKKYTLVLEELQGKPAKEILNEKNYREYGKKLAQQIAAMHALDIIHGDLTTSNIMICSDEVYLIDFGLAYSSLKIEDKAVDLHLLEETLESTHQAFGKKMFDVILATYQKEYAKAEEVVNRLDTLRKKGRYKEHA
jgi:TP53 regulating kinase and related kinases